MESYEDYSERAGKFSSEIGEAIQANDIEKLQHLITSDSYPKLTLEERETQAFISACIEHNEYILKFLIFDYGINEEYFIESSQNMNQISVDILGVENLNQEIKKMFSIRSLSNQLSESLVNDKNPKGGRKI